MKRIMSIIGVVIMSMLILMPMSAFAMSPLESMIKNDPSLRPLVNELHKKGVPDDYIISKLPYKRDMLESMSKIVGKFISHKQTRVKMEQNNSTTNNSTVSPSSVISPNDLLIDVTSWSRSDSIHPTHKDTYTFYADYDWASGNPYWTLTDIFGMAWGGDFTIENNSITCYARYIDDTWVSHQTTAGLATVSTSGGFAYNIDLIGSYNGSATIKNLGWISANVYHYPDVSGSANIVADYYHQNIRVGLPTVTF